MSEDKGLPRFPGSPIYSRGEGLKEESPEKGIGFISPLWEVSLY